MISVRQLLHGRTEHPRQPGGKWDDPLGSNGWRRAQSNDEVMAR